MRPKQIGPKLSARIAVLNFTRAHIPDYPCELLYLLPFELCELLTQHLVNNAQDTFSCNLVLVNPVYLLLQLLTVLRLLIRRFKDCFQCVETK